MQIESSLLILEIEPQILAYVVHTSIYIGYLFKTKLIHQFQIKLWNMEWLFLTK